MCFSFTFNLTAYPLSTGGVQVSLPCHYVNFLRPPLKSAAKIQLIFHMNKYIHKKMTKKFILQSLLYNLSYILHIYISFLYIKISFLYIYI